MLRAIRSQLSKNTACISAVLGVPRHRFINKRGTDTAKCSAHMCKHNVPSNLRQLTLSTCSPIEKKWRRRAHDVHDARVNETGGTFNERRTYGAAQPTTAHACKTSGKVKKTMLHTPTPSRPASRGERMVKRDICRAQVCSAKTPCSNGGGPSRSPPSSGGPRHAHRLGSPGDSSLVEGTLAARTRRAKQLAELALGPDAFEVD